jgi:hypothetical protein
MSLAALFDCKARAHASQTAKNPILFKRYYENIDQSERLTHQGSHHLLECLSVPSVLVNLKKDDLYNEDIKKSSSNLLEIQEVQPLYPCSLLMMR